MDGYYDYQSLVDLDKHLVIAGYLGDETRLIGYRVASLTGLPVTDLDRKIEHHTGKSIWELIWSEGEERYRRLERRYLRSLLAERPCGILSLGDGALIDAANRELVLAESVLVVLDLDLPNCYWRLKSSPLGKRDSWHPLYPHSLQRFEQLRPFFELREPGFTNAHHRIEVRGKQRSELVESVIELL
jgi:shikimate kinase